MKVLKFLNLFVLLFLSLFITDALAIPLFGSLYNRASDYILVFESGSLTPKDRIEQVRSKIIDMGGKITYDYSLTITGFSFSLPEDSVSLLTTMNNAKWPFFVEKDSQVKANS
ncbi:hypothetical protein PACTADRAFT_817 [Pachysolen tannophilus NRRL Y-2460]|uniref:Inhibitor I9 domain-containing protein n=1 Tax=Pachysolen tannophilus NRRL Y-2460 TaxID=669874 RepID=A0A1E4U2U8_PACTA|nr:hypothetical protein PACTADRAFT_817 [Pachysolen tannophilus NRRL Y-2460]